MKLSFHLHLPSFKLFADDFNELSDAVDFLTLTAGFAMEQWREVQVKIHVMARISELAAMEPKYREIQKSLSDAQTVIAGKDASIRNLQTDLAAATARLSAYEQKEKDEQASRIETLVENAIAEGKIDREAKTQWVEMAGSNFELAESTLASIPAREKISKEIADDPANIQATAEATKTAEQLMAEKVAEVVGADFKFRKL